jgi:basic membrane lipoprotein Med (substrate-binding protein (PBP1-ABC) superfamily)
MSPNGRTRAPARGPGRPPRDPGGPGRPRGPASGRGLARRLPRSRRGWIIAAGIAATVVIVGAVLAGLLLPGSTPVPGASRARAYTAFDACLLTDSRGLAGPQAAQAWAGMEAASLSTHAKVEYLPVAGAQTTGSALPYLASLVQRHCNVVVAVGTAPVSAVTASARRFSTVRFAVVGGHVTASNVTVLDSRAGQIRTSVAQAVMAAVGAG